jgi:hypothetical protein
MDYLEQLVSEWYEYQGYFVRHDLWVGLELDGSYEAELNVVAFHPVNNHLVHIEPYLDCLDWKECEQHFRIKFEAGQKYLHRMFGLVPRASIEQVALIAVTNGLDPHRRTVAGAKIVRLPEFLAVIVAKLSTFSVAANLVPEQWPLLRTLQFVTEYRDAVFPIARRDRETR